MTKKTVNNSAFPEMPKAPRSKNHVPGESETNLGRLFGLIFMGAAFLVLVTSLIKGDPPSEEELIPRHLRVVESSEPAPARVPNGYSLSY